MTSLTEERQGDIRAMIRKQTKGWLIDEVLSTRSPWRLDALRELMREDREDGAEAADLANIMRIVPDLRNEIWPVLKRRLTEFVERGNTEAVIILEWIADRMPELGEEAYSLLPTPKQHVADYIAAMSAS